MSAAALWLWESRAEGEDPLLDVFQAQGLSRAGANGTAEGDDVKEQHDQPHMDKQANPSDEATASAAPASAHTPAPWRVEKVLYPAGQDVSFEVTAGRHHICQTIMREIITEDDRIAQDDANTRLIVSAPELLAALRGLVEACKWYAEDTYDREAPHQLGAFSEAVAAIAKAEGR